MSNTISKVIHNGTEFEFESVNGGVTSVNGRTGNVVTFYNQSTPPLSASNGDFRWVAGTGNGFLQVRVSGDWIRVDPDEVAVGGTAPTAAEGKLWYDTFNDVLKSCDGTSWVEVGNGKQSFFKTQDEYNALPASKTTDGNLYIIVDTHIEPQGLCFKAEEAYSTIKLTHSHSSDLNPDYKPSFEISRDGITWTAYNVEYTDTTGDTITLQNIGDKVYMRNVSETPTNFNLGDGIYHHFVMTGTIAVSGDIGYLLCKNSTNTISGKFGDIAGRGLFESCPITTTPSLPATSIGAYAYTGMFRGCTKLTTIPALPATELFRGSYVWMFVGSSIKLSETQDSEYTQPYRIPVEGTGIDSSDQPKALNGMFDSTGGTFTGTPTINTTYYVHKSIRIV